MAREFSKSFYRSKAWKETRDYIYNKHKGLCQDCLNKNILIPGKEVHHIIPLDPNNMNDTDITLGEDNLILLCKECHHKRHNNNNCIDDGLMFDELGNLIQK